MRSPNFLILDEPTNDLDIPTLNVLEQYLKNFRGCLIVISHDRYFMDKVVDHIFVFHGEGELQDFPGNYTDYRLWREVKEEQEREEKESVKKSNPVSSEDRNSNRPKVKMSYKEKREFEELEKEIAQLEEEKKSLETLLCSGTLSNDDMLKKSNRIGEIIELLDMKELRWLELSELNG
jgi:ATP-binding cassette subfamily F protein uup